MKEFFLSVVIAIIVVAGGMWALATFAPEPEPDKIVLDAVCEASIVDTNVSTYWTKFKGHITSYTLTIKGEGFAEILGVSREEYLRCVTQKTVQVRIVETVSSDGQHHQKITIVEETSNA